MLRLGGYFTAEIVTPLGCTAAATQSDASSDEELDDA